MAFSKASKAEVARDYDQAFRQYLQAADFFLHLFRSGTATEKIKQQWKTSAAKALERAEKIKKFVDVARSNSQAGSVPAGSGQPPAEIRLTPVGIDYFSPRKSLATLLVKTLIFVEEQFHVLKKGGLVNSLFFLLWDDALPSKAASDGYS
jgi:calpain-7